MDGWRHSICTRKLDPVRCAAMTTNRTLILSRQKLPALCLRAHSFGRAVRSSRAMLLYRQAAARGQDGGIGVQQENRVFAKAAWRIIPFMMLLYVANFLDRVN